MGWSAPLDRTFVPEKGKPIKTLADARDYLLKLPKSRHKEDDVQTAIEAVLMAAEGRGPVLHATAGVGLVVEGRSGIQLPKSSRRARHE